MQEPVYIFEERSLHERSKPKVMSRMRQFLLVWLCISSWFACDKCDEDIDCAFVDGPPSLAFLDTLGNDLLSSSTQGFMRIETIYSLNSPDYEFVYDTSGSFGGSFASSHTLLSFINDDLFEGDADGEFVPLTWIVRYKRNAQRVFDTINITPIDLSSECCQSLQNKDFMYKGEDVIEVRPVFGFPVMEVVLR